MDVTDLEDRFSGEWGPAPKEELEAVAAEMLAALEDEMDGHGAEIEVEGIHDNLRAYYVTRDGKTIGRFWLHFPSPAGMRATLTIMKGLA